MDLFQRQQFLTISVLKALDTVKLNLKLTSQVPDDITAQNKTRKLRQMRQNRST